MKKCQIILLDEVSCTLRGLTSSHLTMLIDAFSYYAPNYFFDPKFQFTNWDGKIKFITKDGETKIRLLDEIVESLILLKYNIDIVDNRKQIVIPKFNINQDIFSHCLDPDSGEPILLYDYQVEMTNAIVKNEGGIGIAGTGAGKSIMCASLSHSYNTHCNFRTLVIVPKDDLVLQTVEAYANLQLDVGQYCGTAKDLDHPHIISTWQALQHNKHLVSKFQVVIVDECHGARGNVLQDILNNHGRHVPIRIGVTATLPKEPIDRVSIKSALGDVVYEIPAIELIKMGVLAKPNIKIFTLEEDFTSEYKSYKEQQTQFGKKTCTYRKFKNDFFPDYTSEKKFLFTKKKRLEFIAESITELEGNTFCLVESVSFGRKLAKIIPNAIFLYGKDKKHIRKEIYDKFKNHDDMIVISTSQIAYAGLNIKRIFNLVLLDIGKSFIRVMQSIGRGLRKAKDKDSVNIYDICSDLKYGNKHFKERKKIYDEAQYPYTHKIIKYNQAS